MLNRATNAIQFGFDLPFVEQAEFFRNKNIVPTKAWDDLKRCEHDHGFMVAGAIKADLLNDLKAAIQKAIDTGSNLDEFRDDFANIVKKHGWLGWKGSESDAGFAWRTRIIYETNLATSYSAGRYQQLERFPIWIYKHNDAAVKIPRLQHKSWDGLTLPKEHVFWKTHRPINAFGCKCYVIGIHRYEDANRYGGYPNKPLPEDWNTIDPKTGAPIGIGKGFDYSQGECVAPIIKAIVEKIKKLPATLGTALGKDAGKNLTKDYDQWLDNAISGKHPAPYLIGVIAAEEISTLNGMNIAPVTAELMIHQGLVYGPKATRHENKGDALTESEWRELPYLIEQPMAILLDATSNKLIYLLKHIDNQTPQLAIETDYWIKKEGKKEQTNMVVSAYKPYLEDIKARIKGGQLKLIRGHVE